MSVFGKLYRVFTFGESHSAMTGCIIQGFPSNFKLNLPFIQSELDRRKPGQSNISTSRKQLDEITCVSGLENGMTLGSPLCFLVKNQNTKKEDYQRFLQIPRPGHADMAYLRKYGIKAQSGGGRSSARETIGRVIAGAIAKQYLQTLKITFASWVYSVKEQRIPYQINSQYIKNKISNHDVDQNAIIYHKENKYLYQKKQKIYSYDPSTSKENLEQCLLEGEKIANVRCPHQPTAIKIYEAIKCIKDEGDSIGGIIQGCIYNLPQGLGQPVFDKIQSLLGHAMLSIPAVKGFQFGSGFNGTAMKGSQHNDLFNSDLSLKTNYSGGSLGGISTGETFHFKVGFKPVSTISRMQQTSNLKGEIVKLQGKGRHDPCVLPRAPPIIDNMAAIVVMDLLQRHVAKGGSI